MTPPTTEQPLTEPAQQTGQRVASKPDCTACQYFHETYPSVSDWQPPDGECHFDPPRGDMSSRRHPRGGGLIFDHLAWQMEKT